MGTHRGTYVAALLAATVLVVPRPAVAVPRAPFGTTFTSARGGAAAFTLTRPVSFRYVAGTGIPEIAVNGPVGRMTGIVIAQEGIKPDSGAALYTFRFNGCWSSACRTPPDEKLFPQTMAGSLRVPQTPNADGSTTLTLPAGRYRAHVVADGAPVSVTVRFPGLPGRGRIPATARSLATAKTAESAFANSPQGQVLYSAGASAPLPGALGVLVAVMETRTAMHASTVGGTCYYADTEPPNGLFLPGCPRGAAAPLIVLNGVAPFHHGIMSVAFVAGADEWTVGTYLDGVEVRTYASPTALLWLSLG